MNITPGSYEILALPSETQFRKTSNTNNLSLIVVTIDNVFLL